MNDGSESGKREIQVVPSVEELSRVAAEAIVSRASESIRDRGRFLIALSGGSTPKSLFQLLAAPAYASRIDWAHVYVCWGDERCVPPDDSRSNYHMACDALLDHVPIPTTHVCRIRGEDAPDIAACAYEVALRDLFDVPSGRDGDFPSFDLVLLGLGTDGHTASLFPQGSALREESRWVVADYSEPASMWRITLTLPLINAARDVLFLVAGADKADIVPVILAPPVGDAPLPAARVRPRHGRLHWLLDRAAAAKLPADPSMSA